MKVANLEDLFLHTLQDIYFAENQILKALPEDDQSRGLQRPRQARCLTISKRPRST